MQELHQPLERGQRGGAGVGVAAVEPRLDRLGVPVAEIVEREAVQGVHGAGEARTPRALLELGARLRFGPGSSAPRRAAAGRPPPRRSAQEQPGDVPELVRELAALLDDAVGEADVLRRGHLQEPVAGRVGAVLVDHVDRVDAGAEALRHPPPVGREHRRVDDHVAERDLAHELEARKIIRFSQRRMISRAVVFRSPG